MTIKIKAPRAWEYPDGTVSKQSIWDGERRVRIVRESDWRKLMKLVKAMEAHCNSSVSVSDICEALEALEKKK
jgi:hypothetical protein